MGGLSETRRVRIQRAESPTEPLALKSSAAAAAAAIATLDLDDEPPLRRADTRAATEPLARFAHGTSPRASSPSLEIQISPWHEAEHASFRPSRASWLGFAVSPPQVGARIVIGTRTSAEFIVTSPATEVIERDDGVLVVTETNNLYFVARSGDAYLVRRG